MHWKCKMGINLEKKCREISPGEIIPEHTGSISKRKLEMVVIKEALR